MPEPVPFSEGGATVLDKANVDYIEKGLKRIENKCEVIKCGCRLEWTFIICKCIHLSYCLYENMKVKANTSYTSNPLHWLGLREGFCEVA